MNKLLTVIKLTEKRNEVLGSTQGRPFNPKVEWKRKQEASTSFHPGNIQAPLFV